MGWISGVASLGGSLLGGLFGGNKYANQAKSYNSSLMKLLSGQESNLVNNATTKTGYSNTLASQGIGDISQASNYYSNLLTNPAEAIGATASDQAKQAKSNLQTLSRQGGRSGATAYAAGQIPTQVRASNQANILSAKNTAASALGSLGTSSAGLGATYGGLSNSTYSTLSNLLSPTSSVLTGNSSSNAGSLGSSFSTALSGVLGSIFGNKKSNTTGTTK